MHCVQETKFSWRKSLTCPECAQLCFVYCSAHETCAERFFLHYSVAFCSPYIHGRKKRKNTLNMRFSVYFPYLCRESSNQALHLRKPTSAKLRIMHKKGSFHDTPLQLVHNVRRFSSCAIRRHGPYSTKAKNMVINTVSVRLSGKRTTNQVGLLRVPTVNKVTH